MWRNPLTRSEFDPAVSLIIVFDTRSWVLDKRSKLCHHGSEQSPSPCNVGRAAGGGMASLQGYGRLNSMQREGSDAMQSIDGSDGDPFGDQHGGHSRADRRAAAGLRGEARRGVYARQGGR